MKNDESLLRGEKTSYAQLGQCREDQLPRSKSDGISLGLPSALNCFKGLETWLSGKACALMDSVPAPASNKYPEEYEQARLDLI